MQSLTIGRVAAAVLFVIAALIIGVSTAFAAPPNWDTTGSYEVAFTCAVGCSGTYNHDLTLAQDGSGNLTGSGGHPVGAHIYNWVLTSGAVDADSIAFNADYTSTADAVTPQTTMNVAGTIASSSMSGTWTDNYQGTARSGTWTTVSGTADPISTSSLVKVTINKFIDGQIATSGSATSSFPMQSSWNATNLGGAGSGTYALAPAGFNSPNAYEAITSDMTSGSSYATNEVTGGSVVGASCADGKPYALNGYSSGSSLAAAQAATTSSSSPAFTNITSNKYVIVWNVTCAGTTTPSTPTPSNACATPTQAPAGYTLRQGSSANESVVLTPGTMFVGKGGNDHVSAGPGNYIVCLGSGNDHVTLGNGDSVVNMGGGNNQVHLGDGTTFVVTGSGNDQITTGSGSDTVNAGGGNNQVRTNAGNDTITAGSGNDSVNAGDGTDTCNAGGGNNNETSCEL